jgi:hypothetical protein
MKKYKPMNIRGYEWLDKMGKLIFETLKYDDPFIVQHRNLYSTMLTTLRYMFYLEINEGYNSKDHKECYKLLNQYKQLVNG